MSLLKLRFMAVLLCSQSLSAVAQVSPEPSSDPSPGKSPKPSAGLSQSTLQLPSQELLEFLGGWRADNHQWLEQLQQLDQIKVLPERNVAPPAQNTDANDSTGESQ